MTDESNLSEAAFLKKYDASSFQNPLLTIDAALFTYHAGALKVLLVQRSAHPDKGKWGLPGGFVDPSVDQDLEDTAMRVLRAKTGVSPPYLEQLRTYGDPQRDKRGWSVTVCYSALIAYQTCASHVEHVSDTQWCEVNEAAAIVRAFDHTRLLDDARERLRQKALYSVVPAYGLPEIFTLPELQEIHEALIGKTLQKKSFRRRIEQADLLEDTGEKRAELGRPATLYRLKPKSGHHTFLRNLEA